MGTIERRPKCVVGSETEKRDINQHKSKATAHCNCKKNPAHAQCGPYLTARRPGSEAVGGGGGPRLSWSSRNCIRILVRSSAAQSRSR